MSRVAEQVLGVQACSGCSTERCEDSRRLIPILCFWDFAAAFPSVAHLFLMLVLSLSRAPQGFINIMEGMYAHNAAFTVCEGSSELAFGISSGVQRDRLGSQPITRE